MTNTGLDNLLGILPIVLALVVFMLLLLFWQRLIWQKIIHLTGLIALFLTAAVIIIYIWQYHYLVIIFGGWAAPFGINFVFDGLSALMLGLIAVIALFCGWYALTDIDCLQMQNGFLVAYWILLLGLLGVVSTGDLFNLYVWFEITLIGSFILLGLGKPQQWLMNKFKYAILNLLGTMLFLAGIAFIYGITGTLNMADISRFFLQQQEHSSVTIAIVFFLLVAFSVKAAVFPVFSWLPASYHTTSFSASSIMGGLLSKIGVYAIIRLFTLIYPLHDPIIQRVLLILAGFTMVVGVLGAAAQYNYRRILTFHIISQIGYMILGLALFTPKGIAACLFFITHNILTKTTLFLTSGVANRLTGAFDIRYMGGLYRSAPLLATFFLIAALTLAGLPPFSGFWGKYLLIQAVLAQHEVVLALTALLVSMITLYSMIKIWNFAYWKTPSESTSSVAVMTKSTGLLIPTGFMVLVILLLSVFPEFFYRFMIMTANQLLQPAGYINAVLR